MREENKEMALTQKQKAFVEEYVKDYNATQAAIRAGYSEKTAYKSGSNNTKKGKIKEAIEERRKEIRDQLQQRFSSDAIVARNIMFDIMQNEEVPAHVRLSAAKDFLDRAGFKPVEKQEVELSGGVDIGAQADMFEQYLKADDGKG